MTQCRHDRSDAREIEKRQLAKFRFWYTPSSGDYTRNPENSYFARLAAARLDEVKRQYRGGVVLDLCCGAGHQSFALAGSVERIVGVDFSPEMVQAARATAAQRGHANLSFCVANVRQIPLKSESVELVYSFASLYLIPGVEEVVREVARVLKPGGVAIMGFGALYSLNTLVSRAMSDTAEPCHLTVRQMTKTLTDSGLVPIHDRSFQLLPHWGNRPLWMLPLLHPVWQRIAKPMLGGRMLDERISSLPLLRRFAFRHLITSKKPSTAP